MKGGTNAAGFKAAASSSTGGIKSNRGAEGDEWSSWLADLNKDGKQVGPEVMHCSGVN